MSWPDKCFRSRSPRWGAAVAVLGGTWIYIAWRPRVPIAVSLARMTEPVAELREHTLALGPWIPPWVLYNLPDGLWAFAWTACLGSVWAQRRGAASTSWMAMPAVMVMVLEAAQAVHIVSGTADAMDVTVGLAGVALAVCLYSNPRSMSEPTQAHDACPSREIR